MKHQKKTRVLFVCIHNSVRSQMAEALLKQLGGDLFESCSAGLEPGTLNPLAIEVMQELGIDISVNQTKSIFDYYKQGVLFDYVIAVCDGANAEKCPVFPGITKRLQWSIDDPSKLAGSHEQKIEATRRIRDEIKEAVLSFIAST